MNCTPQDPKVLRDENTSISQPTQNPKAHSQLISRFPYKICGRADKAASCTTQTRRNQYEYVNLAREAHPGSWAVTCGISSHDPLCSFDCALTICSMPVINDITSSASLSVASPNHTSVEDAFRYMSLIKPTRWLRSAISSWLMLTASTRHISRLHQTDERKQQVAPPADPRARQRYFFLCLVCCDEP
jgi:hypothetical protein